MESVLLGGDVRVVFRGVMLELRCRRILLAHAGNGEV
jgi:hypothetical protein